MKTEIYVTSLSIAIIESVIIVTTFNILKRLSQMYNARNINKRINKKEVDMAV